MKKVVLFLSITTLFSVQSLLAGEGFCTTCQKVNERNRKNPVGYKYYEDYLKAVKSGEVQQRDPKQVLHEIQEDIVRDKTSH